MTPPGAIATSLMPSDTTPLIALRIQFRAGAIDDPPGREGLNTLTALVIGNGGTQELSYRELVDRLYPMAAAIAANPDREVTTFIGQVHRDHLDEYYRLFRDLLTAPRFDASDFRRCRDLLVAAIESNLRGDDDEELGKETLNAFLYRGHPYGRPDIGTVRGLKAITLDDVKSHYRAHYTRDAALIGLAGGFPDDLITRLQVDFGRLAASRPPRVALPAPPSIEGMEITLVEKPVAATAISIGLPLAVGRGDDDFFPLMVANSFLGEHRTFNGRLMNNMRGERGLNYGDYSYAEAFIQDGGSSFPLANIPRRQQHFSIWIRPVARVNALFALRQATRELHLLAERGLTPAEFDATRKFLLNYSRLWAQSLNRRLGFQIDALFYGTPPLVEAVQDALPRLTVEEVNAAARRHLGTQHLKVVMVTEGAAELAATLLEGRPTPITYQTPTTDAAVLAEDRKIETFPLPVHKDRIRIVDARTLFET